MNTGFVCYGLVCCHSSPSGHSKIVSSPCCHLKATIWYLKFLCFFFLFSFLSLVRSLFLLFYRSFELVFFLYLFYLLLFSYSVYVWSCCFAVVMFFLFSLFVFKLVVNTSFACELSFLQQHLFFHYSCWLRQIPSRRLLRLLLMPACLMFVFTKLEIFLVSSLLDQRRYREILHWFTQGLRLDCMTMCDTECNEAEWMDCWMDGECFGTGAFCWMPFN